MDCRQSEGSKSGPIRPELVRNDPGWPEPLPREELLHQLRCRLRISAALDQKIQNFAFVVDRTPEPVACPADDDCHFVLVPMIAGR